MTFRNSWIEDLRFSISSVVVTDRQREAYGCSFARAAFQRDLASHRMNEFAGDVEAEARAADIGGQGVFEPLKWLEQLGLLLRRDADAVIAYRDLYRLCFLFDLRPARSAAR